MTLKANRVTRLRRTVLPQRSQGPDGACPPAPPYRPELRAPTACSDFRGSTRPRWPAGDRACAPASVAAARRRFLTPSRGTVRGGPSRGGQSHTPARAPSRPRAGVLRGGVTAPPVGAAPRPRAARGGGGRGTPFPAPRPPRHGNVAARAPVRARGHGAGRYLCVAERATALKARVLHVRAWNQTTAEIPSARGGQRGVFTNRASPCHDIGSNQAADDNRRLRALRSASAMVSFDFWQAVRLVMYMLTTFPGRARLKCPSWKHGVNEGAKSIAKPAPYFICTHDKAPKYCPHIGTARIWQIPKKWAHLVFRTRRGKTCCQQTCGTLGQWHSHISGPMTMVATSDVVNLGQFRAMASKWGREASSGERPAAVRLRMSLEGPCVFLHPRAARPAPETSQLVPVSRSSSGRGWRWSAPRRILLSDSSFCRSVRLGPIHVPDLTGYTSRRTLALCGHRRVVVPRLVRPSTLWPPTAHLDHPYEGAPGVGLEAMTVIAVSPSAHLFSRHRRWRPSLGLASAFLVCSGDETDGRWACPYSPVLPSLALPSSPSSTGRRHSPALPAISFRRPSHVPAGNGAAALACTSLPRPPLVPVGKVTASLAGCFSSRPPIQRWTRRHRLFVGTVDAAALAGETFGWAPPRRACRSPSAGHDDRARPRRAPPSTTTSCLSVAIGCGWRA